MTTDRKRTGEALRKSEENIDPCLKTSRTVILKLILLATLPFSMIYYTEQLATPKKN